MILIELSFETEFLLKSFYSFMLFLVQQFNNEKKHFDKNPLSIPVNFYFFSNNPSYLLYFKSFIYL